MFLAGVLVCIQVNMMKKIVKGLADVIVDNVLEFHPKRSTLLVTVGKELRSEQKDVCVMKREEKFGYIEVRFIDDEDDDLTPFLLPIGGDPDSICIFEGPACLYCGDLQYGDVMRGFVGELMIFESSPFIGPHELSWLTELSRRRAWVCDNLIDLFNMKW